MSQIYPFYPCFFSQKLTPSIRVFRMEIFLFCPCFSVTNLLVLPMLFCRKFTHSIRVCLSYIYPLYPRSPVTNLPCSMSLVRVERGSSVVVYRTRNREPGFEFPLLPFRSLGIFVLFTAPQSTHLYKRVPGYRQWWRCE